MQVRLLAFFECNTIFIAHAQLETRVCVKLPSHSYALYQLSQFESFIGSDYHWFRKQRFREKMEAAYHTSKSQIVDRTWLCCFSVALALGESYNDSSSPSFVLGDNIGIRHDSPNGEKDTQREAPPGIELFKQGLRLLKISYEEPAIEQVEALNLIVSWIITYMMQLKTNRRRHFILTLSIDAKPPTTTLEWHID